MSEKPPLGVTPLPLWQESVGGEPSLDELVARYRAVSDAVGRYRDAGLEVPREWLRELGVDR
jgi:hypothetical protein